MKHDDELLLIDGKPNDPGIDNTSGNRPFEDVLKASVSRRKVVAGGLAASAATFLPTMASARWDQDWHKKKRPFWKRRSRLLNFRPVPVEDGNGPWPTISKDYQFDVLIPWGEPIEPGGPEYQWPPNAADQARQVGIGHDGMWFFPFTDKPGQRGHYAADSVDQRGMLAINHEFGRNTHVLGKAAPEGLDDVRTSQHAHGVSVVEMAKKGGTWRTVKSANARRIHVNTPMAFSGPAAGSEPLTTPHGNIPLGTVNNCASGPTPWGTYLTCEENFHGYFGATNAEGVWQATEEQQRYGFSTQGSGYGWHHFDRRFDLSDKDFRNEENRFGWVVEIDPFDATQTPVKRTALGRFKHEGATTVIGRGGRAVVYMGDDQRFDYIYKFVSTGDHRKMLNQGKSPLDEGTLYVARFDDDHTGRWLALTIDNPALAARFGSQAEVLTYARVAADLLGATPMDRPEWISVAPDRSVYCTLTNNSRRTEGNAANPRFPNADGHIIRWRDSKRFTGTRFTWDIFIYAEDTHGTDDTFSDPDGLWADPDGRLFIETDGGQKDGLNNQLIVADTTTGDLARLITGVTGDEITGITVTPDRRTLFINLQHPGNGDPNLTAFPTKREPDGVTIPRDATLVITRKDGGIIGS